MAGWHVLQLRLHVFPKFNSTLATPSYGLFKCPTSSSHWYLSLSRIRLLFLPESSSCQQSVHASWRFPLSKDFLISINSSLFMISSTVFTPSLISSS